MTTDFTNIVERTVATSKEIADDLIEKITASKDGQITLDVVQARAISTQLRITATLIGSLLEENNTIMIRVNELVDRLPKQ